MEGPITQALAGCERGDAGAQINLVEALEPFLAGMIRLVRQRVDAPLKARIDSLGVVNEALNSFLTGLQKQEFPNLQDREGVKRTLATLVERTLIDHVRRHRRGKRSAYAEEGDAGQQATASQPDLAGTENDVGPYLAAWLDEFVAAVRPVHAKAIDIVRLSLEGLDNEEIAREVGLSERYVQVLKKTMYDDWQRGAAGG